MNLDDQLEMMEEAGQTEAEAIDENTEIQDVEDDVDEIMSSQGEPLESDVEHAFDGFISDNEEDYNGYDPEEVPEAERLEHEANVLNSEGYHVEDGHELEQEVIEMEIEDGDIYAYLVDEDDNEIGFVLLDENGEEQEYYYIDMDEYEFVDEEDDSDQEDHTKVMRASDEEEFDLGITREGISEATKDMNAIYKDGAEVAAEFKEAMDDISESLNFMKKH